MCFHGLPNPQDLNPIEHLLDELDKRVRQRQPPHQTLDQLRQMLQQEWRTIPRNNVRNVIESMPRRCWPRVVVMNGTSFNVTGSVLNCDKLSFVAHPLKYGLLIFQ